MKNRIIVFLLFLLSKQLYAQTPSGIWTISYIKGIEKVQVFPLPELENDIEEIVGNTHNKKEFIIDTTYSELNGLLDFISDDTVAFIGLKKGIDKFPYTIRKDRIIIKHHERKIKGHFSRKKMILTVKERKNKAELHLEKVALSKVGSADYFDSLSYSDSNWEVISPDIKNCRINYDFLDSGRVIITRDFGDFGYTIQGRRYFSRYNRHVFLEIYNGRDLDSYVYHLYGSNNDTIYGDSYETNWLPYKPAFPDKAPQVKQLRFVKKESLKKNEIRIIEGKLIGTWSAINNPIPSDTLFGSLLMNQKFEFSFSTDNNFTLQQSGDLVYSDSISNPIRKIISGKWHLSETGIYIKLIPEATWTRYITLKELTDSSMIILYEVRSMDGGMTSRRKIELFKTGPNN